jgi:hypothetical protein
MTDKEQSPYGTREYVCTIAFKIEKDYQKHCLEEFLKSAQQTEQNNKAFPEVLFGKGKTGNEDYEINQEMLAETLKLCKQNIDAIKALLDGKERAIYADCQQYLIDIFSKADGIMFRFYVSPNISLNNIIELEMHELEEHFGYRSGHEHVMYVENDDFSE